MNYLKYLIIFVFIGHVHAGLLIEPYAGYTLYGGADDSGTVSGIEYASTYSYSGIGYGGRLGFQAAGIQLGGDYFLTNVKLKKKQNTNQTTIMTTTSDDQSGSYIGLFLGYKFPALLRVWGTYFFDAELEDQDGADKGDTINGSGMGFGIGFTGLPLININLEYRMMEFNEVTSSGLAYKLTGDAVVDAQEVFLSVSFPIDF